MAYRKIGVLGATGRLGQEVTRALVDAGFEVLPFSRQKTEVYGVSTQPIESFEGLDAIVSTLGHQGMKDQIPLIEKAKKEGVKRFVPSEFGIDHRFEPRVGNYPMFAPKLAAYEAVKAAQFPDGWTAITTGLFDFTIPLFVKLDPTTSTIVVAGPGERTFPVVMRYDIGRMLAHTFEHPERYKDTWIPMANSWLSLKDVAAIVWEVTDRKMSIQHEELTEKTPALKILEPSDMQIFDRSKAEVLPITLTNLEEWIKQTYKQLYAQSA